MDFETAELLGSALDELMSHEQFQEQFMCHVELPVDPELPVAGTQYVVEGTHVTTVAAPAGQEAHRCEKCQFKSVVRDCARAPRCYRRPSYREGAVYYVLTSLFQNPYAFMEREENV